MNTIFEESYMRSVMRLANEIGELVRLANEIGELVGEIKEIRKELATINNKLGPSFL